MRKRSRMSRPLWLMAMTLLMGGCATNLYATGVGYAERGRHDLAMHYLIGAHYEAPDDVAKKSRMLAELDRAREVAASERETLEKARKLHQALGAAKRAEIISHIATAMELPGFSAEVPSQEVTRIEKKVAQETIREVDEATVNGSDPRAMLTMLRTARALNPHDMDIDRRYLSLQRRLTRHVAIRPNCPMQLEGPCKDIADRFIKHVTAARRELIAVVPLGSEQSDSELIISLEVMALDTGWNVTSQGQAEREIQRQNEFKEDMVDDEGDAITETIRASFSTHTRQTSAKTDLTMTIRDLRENQSDIWSGNQRGGDKDSARYYDWRGDHRALETSDFVAVVAHGTDRSAPANPMVMARKAWTKSCDKLAASIIDTLEATP